MELNAGRIIAVCLRRQWLDPDFELQLATTQTSCAGFQQDDREWNIGGQGSLSYN
jgi:hypothetical protein